jgi:hypothetical protein
MNIIRIASAALALALVTGAASAASLVNTDTKRHQVNFMPMHGKVKHYSLASGHSVNINCAHGGTLKMGKVSEQCDAKTSKITIKDGKFEV